jgi:hypothetical protein
MQFDYKLTKFTPGEAEQITGLTTMMQRDWRRRRLLPSRDGHARFDVFEISKMMFLKAMADRGIGPQRASQLAELAVGGIAFGALLPEAAYDEGDPVPSDEEQRTRAASVIRQTTPHKVLKRVMPARYLIIWADGTERWNENVQSAIESLNDRQKWEKMSGPIVVIDQWMLGLLLLRNAGRPLVHVERLTDFIEAADWPAQAKRHTSRKQKIASR